MLLQPTRSTRTYTPFPYTSLFRSRRVQPLGFREAVERAQKIAQGVAQPTVGVRLILQDLRPYLQVLRVVGGDDPEDRKSTRRTPVTNAHLVCRLLLEKKKKKKKGIKQNK